MLNKRNDFDAVGAERMTDTELSKKLGSYQRMESIGILLGVILVITGCIMMFVYRNIIVICILAFSGVALFLLVAQPAQKKKKALMKQQLGGFFRTELTKAFGPEPEPATLPIDWAYLTAAKLSTVSFTECTVTDFHEGEHKGLRFSAANVELRRTVEEKSGPDNDNWMTRTETLFRGIVVRCKDICDPTLDIALNDTFQERKKDDITDPAAFRKHFAAHTADGREANDQVTPQLRDLVQKLESSCQFLYWQVTRGTSPRNHLFPGEGVSSNLYVYSKPWKGVQMSDEYRLISIPDTRFYHCNIKTLNLIPNVMAAQQASEAGCNETVFVRDGYVTECSHSNISMVKDGVFITHPLDNLILPGTERKHIIRWCGELGIPVKERAFTLEELYTADEILVTSTSHPSMRAMELNQKAVGMKNPELIQKLRDKYLNEIGK